MALFDTPINPDYYQPSNEIHFEVESQSEEGAPWVKAIVEFGELQTASLEQATKVRSIIERDGMKARIIRVETLRSQVP